MILVNKSPVEDHLLFWLTTYGLIFTVMILSVSILIVLFVLRVKNKINRVLSFFVVSEIIILFFNRFFAIINLGAMEGDPLESFMWFGYSKNLFYGGFVQLGSMLCFIILLIRLFMQWRSKKKV